MPDRLIALPDNTARPLIAALASAAESIDTHMVLFADPDADALSTPELGRCFDADCRTHRLNAAVRQTTVCASLPLR
jgi:hypothetical protein